MLLSQRRRLRKESLEPGDDALHSSLRLENHDRLKRKYTAFTLADRRCERLWLMQSLLVLAEVEVQLVEQWQDV